MGPPRKNRSVNKKYSYMNEVSPSKDGDAAKKGSRVSFLICSLGFLFWFKSLRNGVVLEKFILVFVLCVVVRLHFSLQYYCISVAQDTSYRQVSQVTWFLKHFTVIEISTLLLSCTHFIEIVRLFLPPYPCSYEAGFLCGLAENFFSKNLNGQRGLCPKLTAQMDINCFCVHTHDIILSSIRNYYCNCDVHGWRMKWLFSCIRNFHPITLWNVYTILFFIYALS